MWDIERKKSTSYINTGKYICIMNHGRGCWNCFTNDHRKWKSCDQYTRYQEEQQQLVRKWTVNNFVIQNMAAVNTTSLLKRMSLKPFRGIGRNWNNLYFSVFYFNVSACGHLQSEIRFKIQSKYTNMALSFSTVSCNLGWINLNYCWVYFCINRIQSSAYLFWKYGT